MVYLEEKRPTSTKDTYILEAQLLDIGNTPMINAKKKQNAKNLLCLILKNKISTLSLITKL